METIYVILRDLHVIGGALGLFSLAIPVLSKKGGVAHRRAGWVFVVGMVLASFSGLALATSWIIAPRPGADRTFGMFLGMVGLLTLAALWAGLSAVKRKRFPEPRPSVIGLGLAGAEIIAGAVMIVVGFSTAQYLFPVFAGIAIWSGVGSIRFSLWPLPSRMAWWYEHTQAMSGAAIAAVTAFLVFGGRRFMGVLADGPLAMALWILPSVVGVTLQQLSIRYWRRRFGEQRSPTPAVADKVTS